MVLYHDINASHASRPLYDFYEIYRLCEDLSVESSVKIREIRSRGSRATGVLIWGCPLTSTFSAPLVAKLWVRPQTFLMCKNVLEVFCHLVVFSGARTLHGGTKKNKKLSYRRGTARRAVSVNVLGNVSSIVGPYSTLFGTPPYSSYSLTYLKQPLYTRWSNIHCRDL